VTVAAWLFAVEGVILAGIGAFFLFLRPALLPEDLQFLGQTLRDVDHVEPQLRRWLRRVFIALGGHALAAGGLTVYIAVTGVRDGHTAAVVVLAAAGAASIGVMTAVNFTLRSHFRWMLLATAGLWAAAIAAAAWSS
jgi:hypothetical protein